MRDSLFLREIVSKKVSERISEEVSNLETLKSLKSLITRETVSMPSRQSTMYRE